MHPRGQYKGHIHVTKLYVVHFSFGFLKLAYLLRQMKYCK